jgi:hypothetical protein
VALYYKTRVDVQDPATVQRWIDLVLPRILSGRDQTSRLAAAYATALRRVELAGKATDFRFEPTLADDQIRRAVTTSLMVVGPSSYLDKAKTIESLDVGPQQKTALLAEAKATTADQLVGTAMRHVQNGGRQTIADATVQDQKALGYVRVTKDKPCFFCAMLASRGLVFAKDSFDISDPRFTGDGTAKVHDHCTCSLKPVYTRKGDKILATAEDTFGLMWDKWGHNQPDSINSFRRAYRVWERTGEILDLKDMAA